MNWNEQQFEAAIRITITTFMVSGKAYSVVTNTNMDVKTRASKWFVLYNCCVAMPLSKVHSYGIAEFPIMIQS